MEKDIVIKIEGLNKKFCRNLKRSMFYGCVDIARDMFGISYDRSKLRPGEFWALKDISFELKKGEALGIIGQNGSGKTTLLRLINGIFPPDSGKISVRGRMGALIAVGAGFHPHMTGKENIYLNGTILGMTRKEIDLKYQEIILEYIKLETNFILNNLIKPLTINKRLI
jgi:lipopolysaccharide transport system ATP-binding protein